MNPIYHTDPPEKLRELPPAQSKPHHPGRGRDLGLLALFFAALALLVWDCVQVYQHPEDHYPNLLVNQTQKAPVSPDDSQEEDPGSGFAGLRPVTFPAENTGASGREVAGADEVIAVYGDRSLSNQTYLYYYWDSFYSLLDYYGSYLTAYLDINKPFDQQQATETQDWNEYLGAMAADSWFQTQMLCQAAQAEGYSISQEEQASLDASIQAISSRTQDGSYADEDAYLQSLFDPCSDLESYLAYQREAALARSYAQAVYQRLYDESYDPDARIIYTINVRHILIQPENAQDEASMTAAKEEAERIYQLWLKDPSEENFCLLAQEYNQDPGSAGSDGLYENVYPGQMVATFNDWCFDPIRAPGDSGIVETSYGYHIMYFVSQTDTVYSDENAQTAGAAYDAWLDDLFAGGEYQSYVQRAVFTQQGE